jgi:nitric oxide reductase NorD protein
MAEEDDLVHIETLLLELERISFVAQRDARAALPSVQGFGTAIARAWLQSARDLFLHDRECGKSFMRHSPRIAQTTGVVLPWTEQAREFLRWVNAHHCLDGFLAQADAIWSEWGEDAEREWFALGLGWCERNLSDGRAYFSAPFAKLGGAQGIAGLRALLAPAESLHASRRLALACYLEGAPLARNLVGETGLPAWARRGADLLAAGRSRGEAWFRLESEESLQQLLESIPGYRGRLHSRFLQLLLRAWLGAEIPFADSDWRPDHGRPMLETDGRRLYLPAVFPSRDEAIIAVEHAAGHLAWDSYSRERIEALFARAGRVHPPLDDAGRITWRPLFAGFGERMFRMQILFDLAEDLRVNRRLKTQIPGFLERLLRLARQQAVPTGPAGDYYRLALQAHEQLLGEPAGVRASTRDEAICLAALEPVLEPDATVLEAWLVAESMFADSALPEITIHERADAYLPGLSFNAARPVYPQPTRGGALSDFRDVGDAHEEHQFEREKQEDAPQQHPEGVQQDPDADIQMPRERTSGSGGRIGVGIPQPAKVDRGGVVWRPSTAGIAYPEWDYREQRYLEEWVRLRERVLEDEAPLVAEAILDAQRPLLKQLTRGLEMQRPMRPAPMRRQPDGDELDVEAVTSFVADKRAGLSPSPLIYRRRAVRHRDTAVLLLADMSTSIMARHPGGDGRIVDRIRAGMMLFAEALDKIGDPFAISGFASKQRDQVHYYWIKDFGENLDPVVRARIAAISGRLASRMGAALRHATKAMTRVSAQNRLLLILSDGRPADYDDGGDTRYLHEDTRMAMKEAKDAGLHPFCITLDSSGSEYLPAIFGPGHYTVMDSVDELPRRLPEIYLRLRR